MIHGIMELDASPDFTVDDIHKIREWNYGRLKDATRDERMADTRKRIAPILAKFEAARAPGAMTVCARLWMPELK